MTGWVVTKLLGALSGPVGRALLIGLLLLGWTVYNRMDAADAARDECAIDQLQERLEAQRERAERAEKLAEEARRRADATQDEIEALETARDELLEELSDAGGSCPIPDDVLDSLRAIR